MIQIERDTRLAANPTRTLIIVVMSAFAYKGLETVLSPALPLIKESLGATEAQIAWVITGVLLTGAVATPLVGRLSDVRNKKSLLLAVLGIVALGVATSGLSTTVLMLTIGQILQGVGLAVVPLTFGIIRDTQTESRIKSGNGWVIGFIYAGTAVALVGSGIIVTMLPWRWLFAVPFSIIVVIAIAAALFVPSCPPAKRGRVDYLGAALLGGGLAVLLIGITKAPQWGWLSLPFGASILACIMLLALFVAVELRTRDSLIDVRLFATKPITLSCLVYFHCGFCGNMLFMAVPMLVQAPRSTGYGMGVSEFVTALLLLPLGIAGAAAAPMTGWLDSRIGSRRTMVVGLGLAGTAFVALLLADGRTFMVLIATTLIGLTGGITLTQAMNTVVLTSPESRIGAFSGLAFVVKAVGGTLGVQLAGSILTSGTSGGTTAPSWESFQLVLCMGVLISATAAISCLMLPQQNRL
ncbi:MFS transporter, partial [Mycolicibacterium porcinum]|uniref:MFS transporter n=1 Tax=Mycolicibacterium porcinum TaxID=39693 RepID=UPI000DA1D6CE